MPKGCIVPLCKNRNGGHSFPRDPVVRDRWIAAVGREWGWSPSPHSVVCRLHFTPEDFRIKEDFCTSNNMLLKPTAVPTVFPKVNPLQKKNWLLKVKRRNSLLNVKQSACMKKDVPSPLAATNNNVGCTVYLATKSIIDTTDKLCEETIVKNLQNMSNPDDMITASNDQVMRSSETLLDGVKIKIEVESESDTNEEESDRNSPFDNITNLLATYKNLCVINVANRLSVFNKEFYDTFVRGEALVKLIITEDLSAVVVTILQKKIFEFNCTDEEMLTFVLKALNGTEGYVYCNGIETKYEEMAKKKPFSVDILCIPYYKIQDKKCAQWFKAASNVKRSVIDTGIHTCCYCLERQRVFRAMKDKEPSITVTKASLKKKVKRLQQRIKILEKELEDKKTYPPTSICKEQ